MSDVTRILSQIESGDPSAAEQLLPLVYDELRKLAAAKLAQEKPGQTLQATALVHEAYLRLVDVEQAQHWNSRGHFFAAAAEAMRRILVEQAAQKRALEARRSIENISSSTNWPPPSRTIDLLALDEALDELADADPETCRAGQAAVLRRLFARGGRRCAGRFARQLPTRHWAYARAWLFGRMTRS